MTRFCVVAPYAGAWIEICIAFADDFPAVSLPTRERGLKSVFIGDIQV